MSSDPRRSGCTALQDWADGLVHGELVQIERELTGAPDRLLQPADVEACRDLGHRLRLISERLLDANPPPGMSVPSLEQDNMVIATADRRSIDRFYEVTRRGHRSDTERHG